MENINSNITPLNHTLFTLSSDFIVPSNSESFADMLSKGGEELKSPMPLLGDKLDPNDYQEGLKNLALAQMRDLQRL
ncbi:hypothetical protein [Helicobacter turcicus]|uniref:Uncharacterized protein n=1 Tax=Helicobacter turcicus TaxID=2867412 RepID=A0ABS7JNR6_9HELI|nr:hypothetical protein [Helicobacter turcicus]MBX7491022.1 hypothetical protein [Helicobacter turcicus]MBX7545851.1 hypothetical protein [Helicobacter turcicus]